MKKVLFVSLHWPAMSVLSAAQATVITGNFTNNPSQDGLARFSANTNLFSLDFHRDHQLAVTWDRRKPTAIFSTIRWARFSRATDDFSLHLIYRSRCHRFQLRSELAVGCSIFSPGAPRTAISTRRRPVRHRNILN